MEEIKSRLNNNSLFKSPLERKGNQDQMRLVSEMVQTKLSFAAWKVKLQGSPHHWPGKNLACANDKMGSR